MGTSISGAVVHAQNEQTEVASLRDFDLHGPTAAVVGAGIAGVHVAYELAQLGFNVTVFERNSEIASGETQYSLPFVGVGLLQPWLASTHILGAIVKNLLFPSACPNIISRDHAFNSVFSTALQRWLYCRTRSSFTEKEVMWYTDNLSRLSVSVIEDIVKRHPEMADHVVSTQVKLSELDQSAQVSGAEARLRTATTAHATPIAIDPAKWTQGLAHIAEKKYGVRFALREHVESSRTYLKYDVESTKSLHITKPDPSTPGARVATDAQFDVVVYASGAQTGVLTWQSSQVPVIGMAGWTVMLKNPAGKVQTALRSLFSPAPGAAVAVSPRCSLFGLSGASPDGTSPDVWYRLNGLLSLDTTRKDTVNVRRVLKRMESYLRVYGQVDVPLPTLLDDPNTARDVEVREYVRAFTPDGVPIIDHSGGAFNTYVCCGFGDQAADFAPGASKILGKLVEQQAQILLEEDREYLNDHGIIATHLPASRRAVVETELEMLMNGVLPSGMASRAPSSAAASCRAWLFKGLRSSSTQSGHDAIERTGSLAAAPNPSSVSPAAAIHNGAKSEDGTIRPLADGVRHISFEKNPFSTDRYRKVIDKDVKDVTHRSPLSRLYDMEAALSSSMDPVFRRMRLYLVKSAREDNIPDFVRSLVMYFSYDADDDLEAKAKQNELEWRIHLLSQQVEVSAQGQPATGAVKSSVERSAEKQADMARRAREMFLAGNGNPGKS